MGQQSPADLLLVSVWESRNLGDRLFEYLHHGTHRTISSIEKEKGCPLGDVQKFMSEYCRGCGVVASRVPWPVVLVPAHPRV